MLTPYQFASNSPIMANDVDGLEGIAGYLMNKFVLPEKYRVSPENMTRLKSAYDIEENTWSEWVFDFMSGTLQGAMDSNDPMSYVNGIVNMYQSSSEDFMAGWTGMDAEGCELTKTERSIALLQGVIPASDMVDQTVDDFILAVEGDGEAAARLTLQAFDIAMGLRAKGGFKKTEAQKSNAVNQGTKDAQNSKAPFRFSSKSERWHGPDGKFIGKPKASQLRDWAKSQGWELQKITDAGFETWVDEAGTKRMKIKPASTQSGVGPWSREPRVTIRDKNGITVDGWDNVVIKKSKTTHAPIILD